MPRGLRFRLWLLLAYLAVPVDLVPDFIPVIGYADDAVLVVWTLRSVARLAGAEAIEKHWPGTSEGLQTVVRLAGLEAGEEASQCTTRERNQRSGTHGQEQERGEQDQMGAALQAGSPSRNDGEDSDDHG